MKIVEVADTLKQNGRALQQLHTSDVVDALANAAEALASSESGIGKRARTELPTETGLHPTMIDWALRTTLESFDRRSLERLHENACRALGDLHQPDLLGVVLSGNVFTAPARAIMIPLLFGVPVLAKASSSENVFPTLLKEALGVANSTVGAAFDVLAYSRDETELETAMLRSVSALSVYGSDQTIAAIRDKCPSATRIFEHGHGLGAAYLGSQSAKSENDLCRHARIFALDVAAYDQRGCLSPMAIFIDEGKGLRADMFAKSLANELRSLSGSLPRGALPPNVGAEQVQWRGLAHTEGSLLTGDDFAVACPDQNSFRPSPGYRNVQVLRCESLASCLNAIAPWGSHLKRFGCDLDRDTIKSSLPPVLRPSICEIGQMQKPKLSDIADGVPPWDWLRAHEEPKGRSIT